MSTEAEVWRVSTVEGVFETDLNTLLQWIVEGCVLPTDKVKKGALNWIEAGRVPKLKAAFNGEFVPPTEANAALTESETQVTPAFGSSDSVAKIEGSPVISVIRQPTVCHNHPDTAPSYLCRKCGAALCADCTRFVGASKIPLCTLCGDLCRPYEEVRTKSVRVEFQGSGFGFDDFSRAVRYPFQHKVALLVGALIYSLLLLAGMRGSLVAWMIMFGCISHVISQVAWGRLDRSFMPDFSSFSMWDDLVVPVFLGVGITIVSWGPVIALVIALFFGVISGGFSPMSVASSPSAQQSSGPSPEDLDVLTDPDADPQKVEEANRRLYQLRPGAQIAQEAERSKQETADPASFARMLLPLLGAGIVILLLLILGIGWATFYYPMALTVAGYTQSFSSVINPLVGLDTIRRMGVTYFKAFGMVVVVQAVAVGLGIVVAIITSPFALPFFGNLPANFINGTITFYFNLVIACLLGLSLYKCADQLGISVD